MRTDECATPCVRSSAGSDSICSSDSESHDAFRVYAYLDYLLLHEVNEGRNGWTNKQINE